MNFESRIISCDKIFDRARGGRRLAARASPHTSQISEDQRASLTVPICVATVRARWSCCSIKHTLYQTYAVGQFRPDGVSVSSGPTALRLNFSSVPTIGRFDIDAHEL